MRSLAWKKSLLERLTPGLQTDAIQVLRISLLLITFVAFNFVFERLTRLPESSYGEASPLLEFFRNLGWLVSITGVIAAGLLARYGKLFASWHELEFGSDIRIFIMLLAATIAWPLATMAYNYYFDQGYIFERLLIVLLLPLLWWRPVFLYPLITVEYLLLWQLGEPSLGGSVFPHKLHLLHALNIFAAFFLLYAATGHRRAQSFLVLVCCLVAASYWLPGLAKLKLAWLSDERLYLLPLSAYAHGWLAFLSADRIVDVARVLMPFDAAMRVGVIVLELSCLFMLWRRWLCFGLLSAVIVFHILVFAAYGFLFWTWIILDAVVLVLIARSSVNRNIDIFNGRNFVVSALFIAASAVWAEAPKLGWYDTPLTYTYRVHAIDDRRNSVQIHPRFFAPYDDTFTMSSFAYLVPDRAVLVGPYGVTKDRDLLRALMGAKTPGDVFDIEKRSETRRYDGERAARLRNFLERFVERRVDHAQREEWSGSLRSPPQFWSYRGELPDVTRITELNVIEVTQFFDGARLRVIRERELMRISMPQVSVP